ncbi:hypothetical protein DMC47_13535 [Nostoc sp. 3335mG]|nr:hypothetical protein DMC47_13535 [Nostoc sp. 3335mG]
MSGLAMTDKSVARPGTRSAAARAKVEAQKAALAAHVAEGGSITGWGKANGIDDGWVWQLWGKIRRDLGWQAA